MGRKRGLVALHKKIQQDEAKTFLANSPGGRYYKPTISDKLASALRASKKK